MRAVRGCDRLVAGHRREKTWPNARRDASLWLPAAPAASARRPPSGLPRTAPLIAIGDLDGAGAEATAARIAARHGVKAIGLKANVAVAAEVEAMVARDRRCDCGSLDILVNNAGITRDNLIHKMTDEDWDAVASVHLKGAFLCSRAAQREMVKGNWGRIVNLSSVSALGNRGQTNYSTAKAGLQGMAKTLAIELGRYGITVNAVAPGFIDTEMTRAVAIRLGRDPEEWKEERRPRDPGAARRRAARHRQPHRLSVQRRSVLHLGPGDLRRRRSARVTAATTACRIAADHPAATTFVTLGETLLRLSPPGMQRLDQARLFEVGIGGSELNVACLLARLGRRAAWVSRLPEGPLGRIVDGEARRHGVDTALCALDRRRAARADVFRAGPGAAQRPRDLRPQAIPPPPSMGFEDAPWEALIAASARVHLSGITPALGPSCRALVVHVAAARPPPPSKPVSYDLNYPRDAAERGEARAMLDAVAPHLELFVVAERDARAVWASPRRPSRLAEAIAARYGVPLVALTRGFSPGLIRARPAICCWRTARSAMRRAIRSRSSTASAPAIRSSPGSFTA